MVRKNNKAKLSDFSVCVEIYSVQFDAGDPVFLDDVKNAADIISLIDSIPIEPYMLVDLYLDVYDLSDWICQESYAIQGCRDLEKLKGFTQNTWNACVAPKLN
jgi:hypothetical protein